MLQRIYGYLRVFTGIYGYLRAFFWVAVIFWLFIEMNGAIGFAALLSQGKADRDVYFRSAMEYTYAITLCGN
jgi:hypothetical protein